LLADRILDGAGEGAVEGSFVVALPGVFRLDLVEKIMRPRQAADMRD